MWGKLSGAQRSSRRAVKDFCQSVLGLSMSVGAIQKCADRVSHAIVPYYEKIADRARSAKVNHVDETPCSQHGVLAWLWVMVVSFRQACVTAGVPADRVGSP